MKPIVRRQFLLNSAGLLATLPGWRGLPWTLPSDRRDPGVKKRLIIMFSPNGMVSKGFWPHTEGPDFEMDGVLKPLERFRERVLVVKGICNQVRGDGDNHMRGMSCLLTGNELFPGNIQGGSDTPAGWAKGISIDQEIKNFLQSQPETRTRLGSLELGVLTHHEANPWTRMVYAGPNQPVAPQCDPYLIHDRLHGDQRSRERLQRVLRLVQQDYENVPGQLSVQSRQVLDTHRSLVGGMQQDIAESLATVGKLVPLELPANVPLVHEQMPTLSRMQIDLLVNSFQNDLNRVATLQYSQSVGDIRMGWLDVAEGHHQLSHEPDGNQDAQDKLRRINTWYAEQLAYLVAKLADTPEPGTSHSLLDHTLIVWTNELGHGNSHTLSNLPMVLVGGGFGFEMGRFTVVDRVSTTRLWLAISHAMGHQIDAFGLAELCKDGPVAL